MPPSPGAMAPGSLPNFRRCWARWRRASRGWKPPTRTASKRKFACCSSRPKPWTSPRFFAQSAAQADAEKSAAGRKTRADPSAPVPDERLKNPPMVTIQLQNLIDFVADVFSHAASPAEEAGRIATYLTPANLTGHDSNGVIRVPVYIRWKKMGSVVPNQTPEVVVDTPSLAVVDGKFGYGQTVAPVAVKIGIEKCKTAGLSGAALANGGPTGGGRRLG